MTQLPTFQDYCGPNSLQFWDANGDCFWFSYKTLVAFKKLGGAKIVRQNEWSTTTGKHLNAIDGGEKKARLSASDFDEAFLATFGRYSAAA